MLKRQFAGKGNIYSNLVAQSKCIAHNAINERPMFPLTILNTADNVIFINTNITHSFKLPLRFKNDYGQTVLNCFRKLENTVKKIAAVRNHLQHVNTGDERNFLSTWIRHT